MGVITDGNSVGVGVTPTVVSDGECKRVITGGNSLDGCVLWKAERASV